MFPGLIFSKQWYEPRKQKSELGKWKQYKRESRKRAVGLEVSQSTRKYARRFMESPWEDELREHLVGLRVERIDLHKF